LNILFLISGVLTVITALVHSIAGEKTTIRPLTNAELPQVPKLELRAVWYMVTVHLLASAIILFMMTFAANRNTLMGGFLAMQFLGYGLVFLGLAIVKGIGVFQVPQWVLLFLIAGLTFWGNM